MIEPLRRKIMDMTSRSPRPGKPTPRLRKADRKKQLLAHAKRLFVELGFQQTTTGKIAKAAGVSEPVLYRHFESKKALFLEVLHEIRRVTLLRFAEQTAKISDPLEKLRAVIDLYLGSTRERALEFRVMHQTLIETDDSEVASLLRTFYEDNETYLSAVIASGQKTGAFRKDLDPRVGAWELIRTALGYTLTLPLDMPLYREPDYLTKAVECVLRCLR